MMSKLFKKPLTAIVLLFSIASVVCCIQANILAAVKKGDKWGHIDRTGKMVIEPQFDDARVFSIK